MSTFVDVGKALLQIRDSRLYREKHDTFEAYCKERWGMARQTAYQLMEGSKIAENVRNCGQTPKTESVVRPLSGLEPEEQRVRAYASPDPPEP